MQSLIFHIGVSGKKDIKQYVLTRNYKIMFEFQLQDIQRKEHLFHIGILCWSKEDVNRYVSTWNFKIMFKFKLQDN